MTMGHSKQRQGMAGCRPSLDMMLAFIAAHKQAHGRAPSVEALRTHMGWKHTHSAINAVRRYTSEIGQSTATEILATHGVRGRKPNGMRRSDWLRQGII